MLTNHLHHRNLILFVVQYRVVGQSGATVRKDINLDSPLVANLEKDSIVDVSTVKGRRAHIVSPVEGWSSIKTETGYVILKKEGGDIYKYRIVLKEGAVIRKGADIDASEVSRVFESVSSIYYVCFSCATAVVHILQISCCLHCYLYGAIRS
jgi:hypothetical protein